MKVFPWTEPSPLERLRLITLKDIRMSIRNKERKGAKPKNHEIILDFYLACLVSFDTGLTCNVPRLPCVGGVPVLALWEHMS